MGVKARELDRLGPLIGDARGADLIGVRVEKQTLRVLMKIVFEGERKQGSRHVLDHHFELHYLLKQRNKRNTRIRLRVNLD